MKKLLLVVGVAGLFALSSCSKDYTCECSNGQELEIEGAKKSDADSSCSAFQATQNIGGSGVSCKIK